MNKTKGKTLTVSKKSECKADTFPDFSGRPSGVNPVQIVEVKGFSKLKLRSIRLDDESKMIEFHRAISAKSIYLRYFEFMGLDRRTSHERLVRVCSNTCDAHTLVIERPAHPHTGVAILAVGRLTTSTEPYVAIFDTLIGNESHVSKLARILLRRLIDLARAFRFRILTGELLNVDENAINLCVALGFTVRPSSKEGLLHVALKL
jgi:acetyltransferase